VSGRRIVFVGPSLAPAGRPPNRLIYLPPVRHGDLFRLDLGAGDVAVIIDGVYQHVAPLRHKEILATMAAGATVIGAASFGALRAAELHTSGMLGVGRVFDAYRTGQLSDDADVALLHRDDGRRLTVALVSVRFAVADLAAQGRLDAGHAKHLLALAAAMHFTERTEGALRASAERAGAGPPMAQLLSFLGDSDVKAGDALDAIARAGAPGVRNTPAPSFRWDSAYGAQTALYYRPAMPGAAATVRQVLACLQLFAPNYPARHRAYVWRVALDAAAGAALVGPDSAARFLSDAGFQVAAMAQHRYAAASAATFDWTPEERAFVRTFRLPPGSGIYLELPPEALRGAVAAATAACLSLLVCSDEVRGGAGQWRGLLEELWSARSDESFYLGALERGFADAGEALRLAQEFNFPMVSKLARERCEIVP
jgi:hypothetical protein